MLEAKLQSLRTCRRQMPEDEAEDNLSRPRTKFWPQAQSGLEDLTSLKKVHCSRYGMTCRRQRSISDKSISSCRLILFFFDLHRLIEPLSFMLFKIVDDVVSAYEIIKLKGYTSWAIGIMVSTLCSAILRNQRQLYTLSTNAKVYAATTS